MIGEVGKVIASIHEAKLADQVICALHSIAACLFPFDSSLVSGQCLVLLCLLFLLFVVRLPLNPLSNFCRLC